MELEVLEGDAAVPFQGPDAEIVSEEEPRDDEELIAGGSRRSASWPQIPQQNVTTPHVDASTQTNKSSKMDRLLGARDHVKQKLTCAFSKGGCIHK